MEPGRTSTDHLLPPLEWPRIRWQAEMWFAFIPFVLGFIAFLFPQLTDSPGLSQARWVIGVPLLLTPALVPVLVWGWRVGFVALRRVQRYPHVLLKAKQAISELEVLHKDYLELVDQVPNGRRFEILKVAYVNGNLTVVVRKKKAPKVDRGDSLIVIDQNDGLRMGSFEVTEIRAQEIYATSVRGVDALWLGYVRQNQEISVTPNLSAIIISQEN